MPSIIMMIYEIHLLHHYETICILNKITKKVQVRLKSQTEMQKLILQQIRRL